jgi:hypothetical protein
MDPDACLNKSYKWLSWYSRKCRKKVSLRTKKLFILKPCQNKKGQKFSRCTVFVVFFYSWQLRKRHRKQCTWKLFRLFLFCDSFNKFMYCSSTVQSWILEARGQPESSSGFYGLPFLMSLLHDMVEP